MAKAKKSDIPAGDLFATIPGFSEPAITALADDDLMSLFTQVGAKVAERFLVKRECLTSWNTVIDYLRSQQGFNSVEQFRVMFLDKRNVLIADEVMQTGTVDHVPVYPREVAKRALALNACALILVHNHPSGDATPSQADIVMTKTIAEGLAIFGIAVHDHLIITKTSHASLKGLRLF